MRVNIKLFLASVLAFLLVTGDASGFSVVETREFATTVRENARTPVSWRSDPLPLVPFGSVATLHSPLQGTITAAAGLRRISPPARITADQIMPIGSATKVLTAVLVMREIDQGRFDLDDQLPDVATKTDNDVLKRIVERHGLQTTTVRMLLNHTSGLPPDPIGNPRVAKLLRKNPLRRWELHDAVNLGLRQPRESPGTMWSYSNLGYTLLGLVIEASSGRSMQTQMQALFELAGMPRTHYNPGQKQIRSLGSKLARGYIRINPEVFPELDRETQRQFRPLLHRRIPVKGLLTITKFLSVPQKASKHAIKQARKNNRGEFSDITNISDYSYIAPAGWVLSTTRDLTRFWNALFAGRLTTQKSLIDMQTITPVTSQTIPTAKGIKLEWGLGIAKITTQPGTLYPGSPETTLWWHGGDLFGWSSDTFYNTTPPLQGTILSQLSNTADTPHNLGLLSRTLRLLEQ